MIRPTRVRRPTVIKPPVSRPAPASTGVTPRGRWFPGLRGGK